MSAICHFRNLDIDNVIMTDLKLNQKKQLNAAILNKLTNTSLYIETPYLINPFGISFYGDANIKEEQKSYSISLKAVGGNNESQENVKKFFEFLHKLDQKIIDYGIKNS